MKTSVFRRKLSAARSAQRKGDYAKALEAINSLIEGWPGNPALLTLRAVLIQLQDEDGPPLEEAKQSLHSALELDEELPDALIELGHFQFSVEDDSHAAAKTFERAVGVCTRLMSAALLGQAKALLELNRRQDAFDCLARVRWLQSSGVNGYDKTRNADDQKIIDAWEELAGIS